jgi:hypothetical protein
VKIRTSDLRFIKHGPQPIKLPLGDSAKPFYSCSYFYFYATSWPMAGIIQIDPLGMIA